MIRVKYHVLKDGEWIRPRKRGFKEMCCDCHACHLLDFRIVEGTIEFRAIRDERATAAARRGFKGRRK